MTILQLHSKNEIVIIFYFTPCLWVHVNLRIQTTTDSCCCLQVLPFFYCGGLFRIRRVSISHRLVQHMYDWLWCGETKAGVCLKRGALGFKPTCGCMINAWHISMETRSSSVDTGSTGLRLASVSGRIDHMRGPGQTAGQATITSARWRARTHARPRVRAPNHGYVVLFPPSISLGCGIPSLCLIIDLKLGNRQTGAC